VIEHPEVGVSKTPAPNRIRLTVNAPLCFASSYGSLSPPHDHLRAPLIGRTSLLLLHMADELYQSIGRRVTRRGLQRPMGC
jgi:hypothetical protein